MTSAGTIAANPAALRWVQMQHRCTNVEVEIMNEEQADADMAYGRDKQMQTLIAEQEPATEEPTEFEKRVVMTIAHDLGMVNEGQPFVFSSESLEALHQYKQQSVMQALHADSVFISHIERHLNNIDTKNYGKRAICKICNKTVDEIYAMEKEVFVHETDKAVERAIHTERLEAEQDHEIKKQQAVEKARAAWELNDGSAVKDFVALQEDVKKNYLRIGSSEMDLLIEAQAEHTKAYEKGVKEAVDKALRGVGAELAKVKSDFSAYRAMEAKVDMAFREKIEREAVEKAMEELHTLIDEKQQSKRNYGEASTCLEIKLYIDARWPKAKEVE